MWKAAVGQNVNVNDSNNGVDDDWETDPDFVNDVNEQEQRWGSTTVQGSGRTAGAIDMDKLRKETELADALKKKKELEEGGHNPAFGYGGKFGVEKDRMDQSAVGHEYIGKVEKHASQKDYATGFGGKYGVQTDRIDKSAVTWDYKEKLQKHGSQKDYATGFGGKYGVQTDRIDKSAVGWDHLEKVEKHESQKDYSKGFGGKYGVQSDRQDKCAVGWDHHEAPQKHESQIDHKLGFGGKFGVQTDRVDKSAANFDEPAKVGTNYTKVKPDIAGAKPSDLRAKFETMGSQDSKSESANSSSVPKKTVHAKAALFTNNSKDDTAQQQSTPTKKLDQSKLAFLNSQETENQGSGEKSTPKQLDRSKIAQFANNSQLMVEKDINKVRDEIAQLKQNETKNVEINQVKDNIAPKEDNNGQIEEQVYENVDYSAKEEPEEAPIEDVEVQEEIVDTGVTAVALYDYQAAADDEISFDPEDIITHIEKIDEGWWRGLCKEKYGLFPANYVQLTSE